MKPALEAPRFESMQQSLLTFERREKSFDWNWHFHPELELTWIRKGVGRRLVGDRMAPYRAGDLVLLGPQLPHTWISEPDSALNEAVVLQFREFPRELLQRPEFAAIADLLRRAGRGLHFGQADRVGKRLSALSRAGGLEAWISLVEILKQLACDAEGVELASVSYCQQGSHPLVSRLERVSAYIEEHFRSRLTLAEVAEVAGLTPNGFSRLFRRMTKQTFVGYRNRRRIAEACRLLLETDLSIIRISGECGFENLANFNRWFMRITRLTPRAYRKGLPRQRF